MPMSLFVVFAVLVNVALALRPEKSEGIGCLQGSRQVKIENGAAKPFISTNPSGTKFPCPSGVLEPGSDWSHRVGAHLGPLYESGADDMKQLLRSLQNGLKPSDFVKNSTYPKNSWESWGLNIVSRLNSMRATFSKALLLSQQLRPKMIDQLEEFSAKQIMEESVLRDKSHEVDALQIFLIGAETSGVESEVQRLNEKILQAQKDIYFADASVTRLEKSAARLAEQVELVNKLILNWKLITNLLASALNGPSSLYEAMETFFLADKQSFVQPITNIERLLKTQISDVTEFPTFASEEIQRILQTMERFQAAHPDFQLVAY